MEARMRRGGQGIEERVCMWLGFGLWGMPGVEETNNGKNILCFGVLGVVHGEMSGKEIGFYRP